MNRYAAHFMTITCAVKPGGALHPAVVHVDGTALTQIVRDADSPLFARSCAFRDQTRLPVLINTSFNVHEEPIVNRPKECLKALQDRRVDFVAPAQGIVCEGVALPPIPFLSTTRQRRRSTIRFRRAVRTGRSVSGWGDGVPWLAIDEVLRIAGWTRTTST